MRKILTVLVTFCSFNLIVSQENTETIAMNPTNWITPKDAKFEIFDNRETLVLTNGRAKVKNVEFTNGTIEVDVYTNTQRSFAGISFREQNNHLEEVYIRFHKSNQVDALQYTPVFNNESNWQLYREHQAKVTYKKAGWNNLKIVVQNTIANVYVNNVKAITIKNLRTQQLKGGIGLWALFGNRFSNYKVTHADTNHAIQSAETEKTLPNIITRWKITKAQPYKDGELSFKDFSKLEYNEVETETTGLLPISKFVEKISSGNFEQNKEDFIVATTIVMADQKRTQLFSFDFSDKIIVYFNGEPLFFGNNSFRQKGIQYMGHLNVDTNKLYLPLEKGKNTIHCVVIDKANGWGLIGKLD